MKHIIFPILLTIFLSGCSCPQLLEHLRRHCPECFDSVHADVPVDVPVPERLADFTIPLSSIMEDRPVTFTTADNITLTLYIDGDDLAAHVAIPPDTIPVQVPVTLPCPECPQCDTLVGDIKSIIALLAIVLFFAWATAHTIRQARKEKKQPKEE